MSTSYGAMVDDLFASAEDGARVEWRSPEMTITKPAALPYFTEFVETDWIGLGVDGTGSGVAGLTYHAGSGLHLVAGFQNSSTDRYWYPVGVSRTLVSGTFLSSTSGGSGSNAPSNSQVDLVGPTSNANSKPGSGGVSTSAVPEPSAALIFGLGWLAMMRGVNQRGVRH